MGPRFDRLAMRPIDGAGTSQDAYRLNTKNIELRGSWLHANLRRFNGDLVPSRIDLNEHIANNDGEFDLSGSRWFDSARAVRLDGTILHAELRTRSGKYSEDRSLDLSLFLSNEDGNFKFIKPSDTKPDNDGPSRIDLNYHDDGDDRHSVFSLLTSPTSATIPPGIPREDRHTPNEHQEPANLATCFVNENGRLVFQMHSHLFGRNGFISDHLGDLPIIGLYIAALQARSGNMAHASRSLASSLKTTIVAVVIFLFSIIGTGFGGSLGAFIACMIGAALTSWIGVVVE
ncbi:hypothetical protein VTN00DRAFT_6335 [Thermoascus crustaceus]|uniref:uncharacterized protein n=1 Tax=Thermoascus crustaceus TaxID=5088 RepID=UPI003744ADA2